MPNQPEILDWNNILFYAVLAFSLLVFLVAYYFIRKSLQPTEDFDSKMFQSFTHEDKQESLQYCISFFLDAYDARQIPRYSTFLELRIRAVPVFALFKKTGTAVAVYIKLKDYYYKSKPLPDYTGKYRAKLTEDSRDEDDVAAAFCLYGYEAFSKLLKEDA